MGSSSQDESTAVAVTEAVVDTDFRLRWPAIDLWQATGTTTRLS